MTMHEHNHTEILEFDVADLEKVAGGNWVTDTVQNCKDIVWAFSFPGQLTEVMTANNTGGILN